MAFFLSADQLSQQIVQHTLIPNYLITMLGHEPFATIFNAMYSAITSQMHGGLFYSYTMQVILLLGGEEGDRHPTPKH